MQNFPLIILYSYIQSLALSLSLFALSLSLSVSLLALALSALFLSLSLSVHFLFMPLLAIPLSLKYIVILSHSLLFISSFILSLSDFYSVLCFLCSHPFLLSPSFLFLLFLCSSSSLHFYVPVPYSFSRDFPKFSLIYSVTDFSFSLFLNLVCNILKLFFPFFPIGHVSPCEHLGTCVNVPGHFRCDCMPGFTGDRCEQDINECESNPCQNDGTCLDERGDFRCVCMPGK